MNLHFQNNVISFTLTNILSFDENMNESDKYDVKIKTSEKWNFSKSIPLRYLLITYNRTPLWHMANNMEMN